MTTTVEYRAPAFEFAPESAVTMGPEVGELCATAHFGPDAQQQRLLDVEFGLTPQAQPSAPSVTVVAPRQNLKTGFLKQSAIGHLYLLETPFMIWSAHRWETAGRAFTEMQHIIEGSDVLSRLTAKVLTGAGRESIVTTSGCTMEFKTRTDVGARGLSAPVLFMDEAFAIKKTQMDALLPLILAQQRWQIVYASSAGLSTSDYLRILRDEGREGKDPLAAYFEWCDDLPGDCQMALCDHLTIRKGCKLDDPARWHRAMPALGFGGRVSIEAVRLLRQRLSPEGFWRECLGHWDDPATALAPIDRARWPQLVDAESKPNDPVVFAVDVNPDRSRASISLAGLRDDGKAHLEVLATPERGTAWVVPRLEELSMKWSPMAVVFDPVTTGDLADAAEREGVSVERVTRAEYAQACAGIQDAVTFEGDSVRHLGQPELDAAVFGATRRNIGDGGWGLDRLSADVNISPLVAATLALWGLRRFVGDGTASLYIV